LARTAGSSAITSTLEEAVDDRDQRQEDVKKSSTEPGGAAAARPQQRRVQLALGRVDKAPGRPSSAAFWSRVMRTQRA
jgi:hypothetical protein